MTKKKVKATTVAAPVSGLGKLPETQNGSAPVKEPAKTPEPAKVQSNGLPKGFIAVKDATPAIKSKGPVSSHSDVLHLLLEGGKVVFGKYQVWTRDMNAPHIQAKKGDSFYYSLNNELLPNVIGFSKL